jgi:hypothetical protein
MGLCEDLNNHLIFYRIQAEEPPWVAAVLRRRAFSITRPRTGAGTTAALLVCDAWRRRRANPCKSWQIDFPVKQYMILPSNFPGPAVRPISS